MLETRELFDSITIDADIDVEHWSNTITALGNCQDAVTACAGAMLMLGEDMTSGVLRDLDCADIVQATSRVLTRAAGMDRNLLSAQLEACLLACERSHEFCSAHAEHLAHCRICAESTTACADACRELLARVHD
ncbi:MAG: four-helix bundle copper-binding protein [Pseudonocardiaceae bacterium]